MKKKLVAIIISVSLLSSFIICCGNHKKEVYNNNSNVNKIDKITFDEVIEEFNTTNVDILNNLSDDLLNLRDKNIDEKIFYENMLNKLNTTVENMNELSYFHGKEKEFINKSIEYFEALKFEVLCKIDTSKDTSLDQVLEKFKEIAERSKDISDLSENLLKDLGFTKETQNLLNAREECIKIMNELGYSYKDYSETRWR